MHRKVSMGTSSNTKALLQTLLWRQQGDIGGRLGKLVIYIHTVMRPIQIFASHIITLMWGFLELKTRTFHLKCHIFVLNRYFTLTKHSMKSGSSNLTFPTNDEQSSSRNIWKVRNTRFFLQLCCFLFLLKFSNFLVGKPPFLQTCVIIHLSWVFFLSEWDEIRKSTLGFSFV